MMRGNRANPCFRVYSVLRDAREEDDTTPTLAAWSNAFGVSETEHLDDRYDTLHMLGLLDREAKVARLQAKENLDIAPAAVDDTFQPVFSAMNVAALSQGWANYKKYLTDDLLRTLREYSRDLPEDSEAVNEHELQQVRRDLEEFAKRVREEVTDDDLKSFLLNQITIIRKAFLEYYIVGVKAFRDASGRVFAELQSPENIEVFEEHKESDWIKQVETLCRRVTMLSATYTAIEKTGAPKAIGDGLSVAKEFFSNVQF